ncbi:hypothetical protein [Hymenobacter crusticola]|nr:hypothetical protein [Hymenobacter crusticola]
MKISLFALLLVLTTATASQAQTTVKTKVKPAAGPSDKTKVTLPAANAASAPSSARVEERANALTENMRQGLALTPQQVEKVRQINLTSVRNMETASNRYKADLPGLNRMAQDIGASRVAALKDVLTPDQFNRYQQKREQKMGVPSTRGAQGNSAPGLPAGRGEE